MRARLSLEERKRRRRERLKLLTANMATYGYAIGGSAFVDPFLRGEPMGAVNILMASFALALHTIANYVVPEGERP